jgi:hypothetical protein
VIENKADWTRQTAARNILFGAQAERRPPLQRGDMRNGLMHVSVAEPALLGDGECMLPFTTVQASLHVDGSGGQEVRSTDPNIP